MNKKILWLLALIYMLSISFGMVKSYDDDDNSDDDDNDDDEKGNIKWFGTKYCTDKAETDACDNKCKKWAEKAKKARKTLSITGTCDLKPRSGGDYCKCEFKDGTVAWFGKKYCKEKRESVCRSKCKKWERQQFYGDLKSVDCEDKPRKRGKKKCKCTYAT